MLTFGLIIAAAAIALGIAALTRLPASVIAIVSGVALQVASAPFRFDLVRDGLLMAATFLVFAVGAEIERRPLRPFRRVAIQLASLTLLTTAVVGALLWALLGLDAWTAIYWVIALSASSTVLVFELLRRRERFFEPIGRTLSATVLVQDASVIVILAILPSLADENTNSIGVLLGVAGLAGTSWLLARWIAPFAMLRLNLDEEERLLFVLLVLFSFTAVARWTGGPLVAGAYFAGMAISRFPVGDLARGYLKSFSDFFSVIFYVALGLVISLPSFSEIIVELAFVAALLLVRPFLLLPLVRRLGLTVRSSIETVTLLAQAGELAVIVAIVGVERGHVGDSSLGMVAAVVAITTAIVPWLSSDRTTWQLTHWYPLGAEASLEKAMLDKNPSGHVLLLGCGETGTAFIKGVGDHGANLVVVDDDPGVVQMLQRQGVSVLRGNGAHPHVLRVARAQKAVAIVSTMRRLEDNARLLAALSGPKVLVRVFSEQEAVLIRELGGHPVVEAEVAADAMLLWYAKLMSSKGLGLARDPAT
jgi:Kef-type K+ transport system membrane component KefB